MLQSEGHWGSRRGTEVKRQEGRTERVKNGWESVFLGAGIHLQYFPPGLYNHICATTHTCITRQEVAASMCRRRLRHFSACALFSLSIGAGWAWEFLQYYLSSVRPAVQPSTAQEAEPHHQTKTHSSQETLLQYMENKTERINMW